GSRNRRHAHGRALLLNRLVRRVDAHDLHTEIVQEAERAAQLRLVDELAGENAVAAVDLDRHVLERPDERPHDLTSDDDPIDSGLPAATGREALLHPGPSLLRSREKRLPWSL